MACMQESNAQRSGCDPRNARQKSQNFLKFCVNFAGHKHLLGRD